MPNAQINVILKFKIMLQKQEHIGRLGQQLTTSVRVDLGSRAKESLAHHRHLANVKDYRMKMITMMK